MWRVPGPARPFARRPQYKAPRTPDSGPRTLVFPPRYCIWLGAAIYTVVSVWTGASALGPGWRATALSSRGATEHQRPTLPPPRPPAHDTPWSVTLFEDEMTDAQSGCRGFACHRTATTPPAVALRNSTLTHYQSRKIMTLAAEHCDSLRRVRPVRPHPDPSDKGLQPGLLPDPGCQGLLRRLTKSRGTRGRWVRNVAVSSSG